MQPHTLVPYGGREGRSHMDYIKLGKLGIGTIGFGQPMVVDVEAVDQYYLMMLCVSGHAEVVANGRGFFVSGRQAVLRAPGDSFKARLSSDCEQLVVRIDRSVGGPADSFESLSHDAPISLSSGAMRAWHEHLALLVSSPEFLSSACGDARVGGHVESLLIDLLTVAATSPAPDIRPPATAPGFVRRAEEIISAQFATAMTLPEIASMVGVPVRTLCDGFLRFRGESPMQFLRQLRLERARAMIRSTQPATRIGDIALECGFTHIGRFSQAYRARFGELPSDTARLP